MELCVYSRSNSDCICVPALYVLLMHSGPNFPLKKEHRLLLHMCKCVCVRIFACFRS